MTQKKTTLKSESLEKALMHAEEMFERALCPFFLFGETLKSACEDNKLKGDKLELGVLKKNLTPEALKTFTCPDFSTRLDNFAHDEKSISYTFEGVPVEIKIVRRRYRFLSNLNSIVFNYGDYLIPNPLEDYWKARYLVQ